MTVIQFPISESRDQRIKGIAACLSYLQGEARDLSLPMLAHIIAVAREEAKESGTRAANAT